MRYIREFYTSSKSSVFVGDNFRVQVVAILKELLSTLRTFLDRSRSCNRGSKPCYPKLCFLQFFQSSKAENKSLRMTTCKGPDTSKEIIFL